MLSCQQLFTQLYACFTFLDDCSTVLGVQVSLYIDLKYIKQVENIQNFVYQIIYALQLPQTRLLYYYLFEDSNCKFALTIGIGR